MRSAKNKTSLSQTKTVGYEVNGKPISLNDLQKKLNRAEKDILKGKVMTTENARAYFKNKFGEK